MDAQLILDQLYYNEGVFPRQALQEAIANSGQITPLLLEVIEEAKQLPPELYDESYMAHIYAMYLLAQFRESQAYPIIVDFFSIPDEIVFECMGDVVTEDLPGILASVAHGDTALIKTLVENENINEYIRGAAMQSLLIQVVNGESTREAVVDYFQSLFRGVLRRKPSAVWDDLVCYSADLYPGELMEDIRQAYKEGLVDPMCLGLDDVEVELRAGKEIVLKRLYSNRRNRFIEDIFERIQWWGCFHSHKQKPLKVPEQFQPISISEHEPLPLVAKTGRNEPCPCGSGKKYKKCCGK